VIETLGANALVVEDDSNIRRSVRSALEMNGWSVLEAETLASGMAAVAAHHLALAVIDLGLPDGDGVALVRSVRERFQAPIIVLSARSEEHHKVRALDAGADDYVEKPFRVAEFLARVRAHIRRSGATSSAEAVITVGNVEFDPGARLVRKNGSEVRLTRTQYKLFAFLVANAGRVLTHRQLLLGVWGPARVEHGHYLRVYMASLRQKLEDDPARPKLITTETGVGYRLVSG